MSYSRIAVLFLFSFSMGLAKARTKSDDGKLESKRSANINAEASLKNECKSNNLPLDLVIKCLNAGYILKFGENSSMDPNAKNHLARITRCDVKTNEFSFRKCLQSFVDKNPRLASSEVDKCWQLINEDDFRKCWGWTKEKSAELQSPQLRQQNSKQSLEEPTPTVN